MGEKPIVRHSNSQIFIQLKLPEEKKTRPEKSNHCWDTRPYLPTGEQNTKDQAVDKEQTG